MVPREQQKAALRSDTLVIPANTSVPLGKPHLLQETSLATQSPTGSVTPTKVPLRLILPLAKVLPWTRRCSGKVGEGTREASGPRDCFVSCPGWW